MDNTRRIPNRLCPPQQNVPGTKLRPQQGDGRLPIMLIQRTFGNSISSKSNMHGWTLLLPTGWSMPFFTSLVFTGSRVAGLRERRVQQFECGSGMAFPEDYPTTKAFLDHSSEIAAKERARWERTPPAKRANFDAVEQGGVRKKLSDTYATFDGGGLRA